MRYTEIRTSILPQRPLKFDNGRNSSQFLNPKLLKEAYIPYSNEYKGTKNYGLE
jgi:hypothetical protein